MHENRQRPLPGGDIQRQKRGTNMASTLADTSTTEELLQIRNRVAELRQTLIEWEAKLSPSRDRWPGGSYDSARNLAHYLALRSEDLRPLQKFYLGDPEVAKRAAAAVASQGKST